MSASRMPTDAPSLASASARFTAVVLLPTPPLPDATATMFFTFGNSFTPRCTVCAAILLRHLHARFGDTRHGAQRVADQRADRFKLAFGRIAEYHFDANRGTIHGDVLDVFRRRERAARVGVSDVREGGVDQCPINAH